MIRARFLGVDRFQDERISELTGCARDATGLWALFADSIPAIDARCITNEDVTHEAIGRALDETFEAAEEDDAVIFTFAGHGTHDHRLVAHDTALTDLDATTVPVDDLAVRFRRCRARFVLCVIDCCFSGSAPARVVMDTPTSRGILDFSAFEGTGRLLITACRPNESAYEHPLRRHGLLTVALLDALTEHDPASLLTVVDAVVARVRADAATLGAIQNPVATTYIDGGFTLPRLVRGAHFAAAFPENAGLRVENVAHIARFGIPSPIIAEWESRFGNHLHQLQLDAINECRVLDGASLFALAPTSSGKTFIGELAAVRAVLSGRKAIFLLPYKSLVNEQFDDFSALYGERLGMRVIKCKGDSTDAIPAFIAGKYDIAFLTNEMFLQIAVNNLALLNLVGLVVIDEAQFITDRERGITVELTLTLLRSARERGIAPQLVLLSATLGDIASFDAWLGVRVLRTDVRPVPLEFGVLDRSGVFEYLDAAGVHQQVQLLSPRAIVQRKKKPEVQDLLVPLARMLMHDTTAGETLLVFRAKKGSAEGCAQYLADELHFPPAAEVLAALPVHDLSTTSATLRNALRGGVAFHTSDLMAEERIVVERAFRARQGPIRVLTGTSGVAAGINTPASTVIIAETVHAGPEREVYSLGDVRNMAGRAGRYGYRETGRAIILADTAFARNELFRRYVATPAEPMRSSFDVRDLPTWLLRLLSQVREIPRDALLTLLLNTYGGYLNNLRAPGFSAGLERQLTELLTRMIATGMVAVYDDDRLSLTPLGKACGGSSLSFESALRLLEIMRPLIGNGSLAPSALMALGPALPELDEQIFLGIDRRGMKEHRWISEAAIRFGNGIARALQHRAEDAMHVASRAKKALVLDAWINGAPTNDIERRFSLNPFHAVTSGSIRGLADAARFRLRSIYDIVLVAFPESAPDGALMEDVLAQLETGLPAAALPLLQFSVALDRGQRLALFAAGVHDTDGIRGVDQVRLASLVGEVKAAEIAKHQLHEQPA